MENGEGTKRNDRNCFYYGSVLEKRFCNQDGIKTATICIYKTIGYRENENIYYDFLSGQQLPHWTEQEKEQTKCNQYYFLEHDMCFEKGKRKKLNYEEKEKICNELYDFAENSNFKEPYNVRILDDWE